MADLPPMRNPAVASIFIILLIGIIFYVVMMPPAEREKLLPPVSTVSDGNYSKILISARPGELDVSEESKIKTIPLDSLVLDYRSSHEDEVIAPSFTVQKSLAKAESASFQFEYGSNEEVGTASLSFQVYNRIGEGQLMAWLNGYMVYSKLFMPGEVVTIKFPPKYLISGVNEIRFSVSSPGWSFWQTNSYVALNLRLVTDTFNSEFSSKEQSFSLTAEELANAQSAILKAYAINRAPEAKPITIWLNGEDIYSSTPSANIDVDIPPRYLEEGMNTLSWTVGKSGAYQLSFVKFILDTTKVLTEAKTYTFEIDTDAWNHIQTGDYDCLLAIRKSDGEANELSIKVNSDSRRYSFTDDEIKETICSHLEQGKNTLRISASEQVTISELSLKIVKEE